MYEEMVWQKKLRSKRVLFWFSNYMSLWSKSLFLLAVIINIIVALFYPFPETLPSE
jgi:hypothetical protein